jgi:hypothetical protein
VEVWFKANVTYASGFEYENPLLVLSTDTATGLDVSLNPNDVQAVMQLPRANLSSIDPQNLNAIDTPSIDMGTLNNKGGVCERTNLLFFCTSGTDDFFTRLAELGSNTDDLVRLMITVTGDTASYYYTLGSTIPTVEYAVGCYDFAKSFLSTAYRARFLPANSRLRLGCSTVPARVYRLPSSTFVFYGGALYNRSLSLEEIQLKWNV